MCGPEATDSNFGCTSHITEHIIGTAILLLFARIDSDPFRGLHEHFRCFLFKAFTFMLTWKEISLVRASHQQAGLLHHAIKVKNLRDSYRQQNAMVSVLCW